MLIYIYLIYWLEVLLGTLLEYMELKFFLFNFVEKSYEIFNIEMSDFKLNQILKWTRDKIFNILSGVIFSHIEKT